MGSYHLSNRVYYTNQVSTEKEMDGKRVSEVNKTQASVKLLIINQISCYNEATGPDRKNSTDIIDIIFGNGSKCSGMCFICFIWVIKQELLPTRHINLLTNNYIQCFFLRKKCKSMGNIGFIHCVFLCL